MAATRQIVALHGRAGLGQGETMNFAIQSMFNWSILRACQHPRENGDIHTVYID